MPEEKKEEKKVRRPLGVAKLIPGKCAACGARCESSCPKDAIEMNDKGEPVILLDKCIGCRKCIKVCPATAIEIYYTPEELKIIAELDAAKAAATVKVEELSPEEAALRAKLKEYKGVWVIVEQTNGQPAGVSWELLGVGAELARTNDVELCAVVIGEKVENLCREAFAYGAEKAYLVDDPVFKFYRTEPYYKAICHLIEKHKPEIVLFGATGLGRDLAGAVATQLKTGLTADCTGLAIDERGFLLQTRPAFGGNIMATILTERTRPQMATVRPHVMIMPEKNTSLTGEIVRERIPVEEKDFATKVLEIIEDTRGGAVDLAAAEIIVSGGRGMCAPENFKILEELAGELGGVVGCSRSVVEAGWLPVEHQVGQTGKTVRPKIYFACGISGAIQHLVGMQDSDVIIAINQDKRAPIFEVATYGIVGDCLKVVPAITRGIKEARAKKAGVAPGYSR
jgi:electron transfer flavoprotein alpha subunit